MAQQPKDREVSAAGGAGKQRGKTEAGATEDNNSLEAAADEAVEQLRKRGEGHAGSGDIG